MIQKIQIKNIQSEFQRILIMLDIQQNIRFKSIGINIDMEPYKDIVTKSLNNNNIKGIILFQKDILSGWQGCESPELKRKIFQEYKKRLGTNVEDDVESYKDIVYKILKRKMILDLEEYRALYDYVSDNFDTVTKQINKINKLMQEFEKANNLLE